MYFLAAAQAGGTGLQRLYGYVKSDDALAIDASENEVFRYLVNYTEQMLLRNFSYTGGGLVLEPDATTRATAMLDALVFTADHPLHLKYTAGATVDQTVSRNLVLHVEEEALAEMDDLAPSVVVS